PSGEGACHDRRAPPRRRLRLRRNAPCVRRAHDEVTSRYRPRARNSLAACRGNSESSPACRAGRTADVQRGSGARGVCGDRWTSVRGCHGSVRDCLGGVRITFAVLHTFLRVSRARGVLCRGPQKGKCYAQEPLSQQKSSYFSILIAVLKNNLLLNGFCFWKWEPIDERCSPQVGAPFGPGGLGAGFSDRAGCSDRCRRHSAPSLVRRIHMTTTAATWNEAAPPRAEKLIGWSLGIGLVLLILLAIVNHLFPTSI